MLIRILGALLLVTVLLVALVQTPPGKRLFVSSVTRLLSRSDNLDVHIGTIKGWVPGNMYVDRLDIADADGIWLSVHHLHARWKLQAVLQGRIQLQQLEADRIEIVRLPKAGSRKPGAAPMHRLEDMEFVLDGLRIDQLVLDQAVAGTPLQYSISSGGLSLKGGELSGGLTIRGDADGRVDILASLAKPESRVLHLQADLKALHHPRFGQDRISGSGEATIDPSGINAQIDVEFSDEGNPGHLTARLHKVKRRVELRDFRFSGPTATAEGSLDLDFAKNTVDIGIAANLSDVATNQYALRGTARVVTTNKTWAADIQSLNIQAGELLSVDVSGTVSAEQVALQGRLAEFDVGQLPRAGLSNYTGRVGGRFSMRGPTTQPLVDAGIDITGFRSTAAAFDELPSLDLQISGGVSNGVLYGSTKLSNFNNGYLTAEASVPCTLSLSPFKAGVDRSGLDGSLESVMNLDVFNRLAIMEDQFVAGVLTVSLVVKDGEPAGYALMEKGAYEHYEWGILFRDFNAELQFIPDGILIRKAGATDGHEGRLRLAGGMHDGMLDVVLNLSAAKVIRRPEVGATISGEVNLSGRFMQPVLRGILLVEQADILPDNILPPKPELLTSFDAAILQETPADAKSRKTGPFDLDLRVEMPGQLHVSASLIDSIWAGTLRIQDSSTGFKVEGRIEPQRGYLDFIGKKFRFLQGTVEFDGSVPPMPVLNDLTAEYERGEVAARLVLNGKFNNPQYRLESTPSLPEDEILSQVLFNRDTSSISAYQAFQIASAAQQLSGGLNGPGFMYQFRRAAGIDTFELREPDEEGGNTAVAAGKYIASGLYVEVSSTFGAEAQTDLTAEYDINRNFSIETSAGPSMRPGIGLNWKLDY